MLWVVGSSMSAHPSCPFLFYKFSFKFVYTFPLFVYSRSTYLVFKLLIYFKTPSDQLYTFPSIHYYIVLSPAYNWVVTRLKSEGYKNLGKGIITKSVKIGYACKYRFDIAVTLFHSRPHFVSSST